GTVKSAIERLGASLGEVEVEETAAGTRPVYNYDQQAAIQEELEKSGSLAHQFPEGVTSIFGISRQLGVSHKVVQAVAEALQAQLGTVEGFKFGSRYTL